MPSETVWIIVREGCGAYYDFSSSRRTAIAKHVNDLDELCYAKQNIWGPLTDDQKRVWKECRKRGDRAVRATLTWDESSGGGSDG